jgi:hypothetical protein
MVERGGARHSGTPQERVYRREESAKFGSKSRVTRVAGQELRRVRRLSRQVRYGGKMEQRGGGGIDGRPSVPTVRVC